MRMKVLLSAFGRHWLAIFLLSLGVGGILTIGQCILIRRVGASYSSTATLVPDSWPMPIADHWGPPVDGVLSTGFGVRQLEVISGVHGKGSLYVRLEDIGWPVPMIQYQSYRVLSRASTWNAVDIVDGEAVLRSSTKSKWRFPDRVFGVAIVLQFVGVVAVSHVIAMLWLLARASLWRSHGRCTLCGYELKGSPLCPECGQGIG